MTNRETRKEQYEDALFALLMDDMAQEDGEELLRLNEQLKHVFYWKPVYLYPGCNGRV